MPQLHCSALQTRMLQLQMVTVWLQCRPTHAHIVGAHVPPAVAEVRNAQPRSSPDASASLQRQATAGHASTLAPVQLAAAVADWQGPEVVIAITNFSHVCVYSSISAGMQPSAQLLRVEWVERTAHLE